MDMVLQYYNQPQIAVEEQIRLLKSEGLSFDNECRAKQRNTIVLAKSCIKCLDLLEKSCNFALEILAKSCKYA